MDHTPWSIGKFRYEEDFSGLRALIRWAPFNVYIHDWAWTPWTTFQGDPRNSEDRHKNFERAREDARAQIELFEKIKE